jgi:3-methylcrotonyl-CoA carboxylase alpha subunit
MDTGYQQGDTISVHYDPMMAKLIAWGANRTQAAQRLHIALEHTQVAGVRHNAAFLAKVLAHPDFLSGHLNTRFIEDHAADLLEKSSSLETKALLTAALYTLQRNATRKENSSSPWQALKNFRLAIADTYTCYLSLKGHTKQVLLTPKDSQFHYEIDGKQGVCALQLYQDTAILLCDGIQHSFALHSTEKGLDVFIQGECIELIYHQHLPQSTTQLNDKHYKAPMNGRIVAVAIAEGTSVNAGDTLLVMEAMKMEHRIRAHKEGIALKINVQVGDLVSEGQILAEIETTEE